MREDFGHQGRVRRTVESERAVATNSVPSRVDMQTVLSSPPHPAAVKSSARAGTRRMTPELRALVPPAIGREEQLELATNPDAAAQLARDARILFHTSRGPVVVPVDAFEVPDGGTLRPARRIGTYRGAKNRIALHPHMRGDSMVQLMAESLLELAWLRRLELEFGVDWLQTQPFVLVWPYEGRCIWRIPDILYRRSGWRAADVKPDELVEGSPLLRAMFALTAMTLDAAGVNYSVAGSLTRAHQRTLATIGGHRWISPELSSHVAAARRARRESAGGVVDSVGGGAIGWVVLFHLLTRELEADLSRPLRVGTPVSWPRPRAE